MHTLTDRQQHVACCALRIAAAQYDEDQKACEAAGDMRTAQAFKAQAQEARELEDTLT